MRSKLAARVSVPVLACASILTLSIRTQPPPDSPDPGLVAMASADSFGPVDRIADDLTTPPVEMRSWFIAPTEMVETREDLHVRATGPIVIDGLLMSMAPAPGADAADIVLESDHSITIYTPIVMQAPDAAPLGQKGGAGGRLILNAPVIEIMSHEVVAGPGAHGSLGGSGGAGGSVLVFGHLRSVLGQEVTIVGGRGGDGGPGAHGTNNGNGGSGGPGGYARAGSFHTTEQLQAYARSQSPWANSLSAEGRALADSYTPYLGPIGVPDLSTDDPRFFEHLDFLMDLGMTDLATRVILSAVGALDRTSRKDEDPIIRILYTSSAPPPDGPCQAGLPGINGWHARGGHGGDGGKGADGDQTHPHGGHGGHGVYGGHAFGDHGENGSSASHCYSLSFPLGAGKAGGAGGRGGSAEAGNGGNGGDGGSSVFGHGGSGGDGSGPGVALPGRGGDGGHGNDSYILPGLYGAGGCGGMIISSGKIGKPGKGGLGQTPELTGSNGRTGQERVVIRTHNDGRNGSTGILLRPPAPPPKRRWWWPW